MKEINRMAKRFPNIHCWDFGFEHTTQKPEFVAKVPCKFQMVWHLASLCPPTVLSDTEGTDLDKTLLIVQYKNKNRNKCHLVLNGVAIF